VSTPDNKDGKGGALRLAEVVGRLKSAAEKRTGYERHKFHLWVDADHDGCETRKEILIAEAVKKPREGENCRLTGGSWRTCYDFKTVTDAGRLDIDHVVHLALAWDSASGSGQPKSESSMPTTRHNPAPPAVRPR
jgi:hypothetical protein